MACKLNFLMIRRHLYHSRFENIDTGFCVTLGVSVTSQDIGLTDQYVMAAGY